MHVREPGPEAGTGSLLRETRGNSGLLLAMESGVIGKYAFSPAGQLLRGQRARGAPLRSLTRALWALAVRRISGRGRDGPLSSLLRAGVSLAVVLPTFEHLCRLRRVSPARRFSPRLGHGGQRGSPRAELHSSTQPHRAPSLWTPPGLPRSARLGHGRATRQRVAPLTERRARRGGAKRGGTTVRSTERSRAPRPGERGRGRRGGEGRSGAEHAQEERG